MALDSLGTIYFGIPYLSQESMVLTQLILYWAFSYSLTKLQNYSLCESLIKSCETPKSGKTTAKYINKSLKKHHGYIYWEYHWLGISIFTAPASSLTKRNSKFEALLVEIFSLKQTTKSNISSYYRKNQIFYSSRKRSMVPLDKGLQWVNLK